MQQKYYIEYYELLSFKYFVIFNLDAEDNFDNFPFKYFVKLFLIIKLLSKII